MLDVDATLAEIRAALETYNALPEMHECESCSQRVDGRQPKLACHECGVVAPVRAAWMEREAGVNGEWKLRVRTDADMHGFQLRPFPVDGVNVYECLSCRTAREQVEREAEAALLLARDEAEQKAAADAAAAAAAAAAEE